MIKITYCLYFLLLSINSFSQTKVIKAAKLLDVKTGKIIVPAVVVIKDGLIQAINPDTLPANALQINLPNKTLLPGLMDCHVHLQYEGHASTDILLKESTTHAVVRT